LPEPEHYAGGGHYVSAPRRCGKRKLSMMFSFIDGDSLPRAFCRPRPEWSDQQRPSPSRRAEVSQCPVATARHRRHPHGDRWICASGKPCDQGTIGRTTRLACHRPCVSPGKPSGHSCHTANRSVQANEQHIPLRLTRPPLRPPPMSVRSPGRMF